jgi:outer membrane protein OmpA-like peptidoglycan-associated protein
LFWSQLFGSDDDPVLLPGDSVEVTTTSEALESSSSSADTDTTVTTETTSTTSTTTTIEPLPLIPDTAWELLDGETNTDQFAAFGSTFGLQEVLEGADNSDAPEGFTLLAPSNDAISALSQEQVAGFGQDPASAEALIGYHIIDQRLTPELLLSAAGGQIESRIGLPIDVSLDGDDVVLNGQARVSLDSLVAGNGNVLVIDSVLQPPTINSVIDLGEVQFEVISAIITPQGEAELQKAVAFFQDNPDANALIEGHTDTDGPAEPNQRLSERRAEAVRAFLISQGIDGTRLTSEGFGETQPIVVDGAEDKAASRRIELNIR